MNDDWRGFPVILGYGSASTLSEYSPEQQAQMRKRPKKRRRIGFHIPPKERK